MEPSEQNKKLEIILESPDSKYYRRSEMELTPQTLRLMQVRYPEVTRGEYIVIVILHTVDGPAEAEARSVHVTERKGYKR